MKDIVRWTVILVLLAVYGAALLAVLHPHVSPAYRAFFIDRVTTDYLPDHYQSTPEEGMSFSHVGLPSWVEATRGFSVREDWGRWTDADLGRTAELSFNRQFSGELCLDFTAHAVPWMTRQLVRAKMGDEEHSFEVIGEGPNDYRVQFAQLRDADKLDFLLPAHLPEVADRAPNSGDTRRLGINISTLRLVPGACSPAM